MDKSFFSRSADIVARELLGRILCRRINRRILKALVVETEAYFDERDPASRARKKGDLRDTMKMEAGTILVYGVHNNWLINFVTGDRGVAQAVLIRALKPLNFKKDCSGPGKLTKILKIDKRFHKRNILSDSELWIEENGDIGWFDIKEGKRIGIKEDLPGNLRFYINDKK